MTTLLSVVANTLSKVTKNNLFYLFFVFHPNNQKIYITDITNSTYISSTAHIFHRHHIHITNVTCLKITSQVIQVLHHSQPQVQIEVPLTTTSIITANETNLVKDLKHEALHSMPPIDST
jgi:hypothetical protein